MKAIEFIENEIGNAHDNPNLDNEMLAELFDKYAEARAGNVNAIVSGLKGEVIKIGEIYVDDELLPGMFVEVSREEFLDQDTNYLYQKVKIVKE